MYEFTHCFSANKESCASGHLVTSPNTLAEFTDSLTQSRTRIHKTTTNNLLIKLSVGFSLNFEIIKWNSINIIDFFKKIYDQ